MDHDRAAAIGRRRRLIVDIDRVAALAAGHSGDDPEWREVSALLSHLRTTLSRDLSRTAPR